MIGPVEFWKKHPYIEKIEVSSFGRVRSVKGHCYKGSHDRVGYLKSCFRINGKFVNKKVHRLVAEAFIPNPNSLPQVNHKDCNRANNNASNLEWCDGTYNSQYREKSGEALGVPIFTVNLATLEFSRFRSQREASRTLRIDVRSINKVIKGRRKTAGGYWFVNDDDKAVDVTKHKLHEICKTGLKVKQTEDTMSTNKASKFVRQVLAAYALERKLAYGEQTEVSA